MKTSLGALGFAPLTRPAARCPKLLEAKEAPKPIVVKWESVRILRQSSQLGASLQA